jgi:hypothetical protein
LRESRCGRERDPDNDRYEKDWFSSHDTLVMVTSANERMGMIYARNHSTTAPSRTPMGTLVEEDCPDSDQEVGQGL